jgi:hypothetical protein
MAAITADNTTVPKFKVQPVGGTTMDYPVAASTAIYKWSFVGLNATGYLTSHVSPTASATASGAAPNGTRFIGIATQAIASQTSDGDATCKVQIDGYFEYTHTGIAVTDVGNPVFLADNATLVAAAGAARTGPCIGYIVQRAAANTAVVRLDPFLALDTGKLLTVTSAAIDLATVNDKILLVHETQNPTGLLLCTCAGYCTTTHLCTTTAGIITIQHTADTTLGCTLTVTNEAPVGDLVVGSGGSLWNPASATDDNIIIIPAGVQVNAEVTTASNEGAVEQGELIICATFVRV